MSDQDLDTCPHCEGVGAYWDDQTGQPDEPNGGRMVTCETCKGEKVVDTSPCIACGAPSYDHDAGCPIEDCPDHGLTSVKTNEHGDAWCGQCGERLIIPGHAGYPEEVRT